VTLDLRSEPKVQPPAAHALQIPRSVRSRDRALRVRERDSGCEFDLRGFLRRNCQLEIRIVLGFDREKRVVAERVGVAHLVANPAPRRLGPFPAVLHVRRVRHSEMEAAFNFYCCHAGFIASGRPGCQGM
jgi:hypothetical protein